MPRGWTVKGWAQRLRQMADRCEQDHPTRAEELRRWADGNCTNEDLYAARLSQANERVQVQRPRKAAKRDRAAKTQRSQAGLLFGAVEAAEDDGVAA